MRRLKCSGTPLVQQTVFTLITNQVFLEIRVYLPVVVYNNRSNWGWSLPDIQDKT